MNNEKETTFNGMSIEQAKQVITERYQLPETQNIFNLAGYLAEATNGTYPTSESQAVELIIAAATGKDDQPVDSVSTVFNKPKRRALLERLKDKKIGEIVSISRHKHNGRKYTNYVVQSDSQLSFGDVVIDPGRNGSTVWMEVVDNTGLYYDCRPI